MEISKNRIHLIKKGLIVLSIDVLAQRFNDEKSKEDAKNEVDEIHILIKDLEIYESKQYPTIEMDESKDGIFESMKIKSINHFL